MSTRALVLSTFVAGLAACRHDDASTGLHADYHHSAELEPCAGNAAAVDALVAHIAETIGLPLADVPHIRYSWLSEADYARESGCGAALSCGDGDDVYSVMPIAEQAIARAVLLVVNTRPSPFLAHGLSTALGSIPLATSPDERDPRPYLSDFEQDRQATANASAGAFVAWLLQVHGAERMRSLYRTIPYESTRADWEAAFAYIYGDSVDSLVAAYLAADTCPGDVPPRSDPACAGPRLEVARGVMSFERVLACGDDDVVGGIDDETPAWIEAGWGYRVTRRFTVATAGDYAVTVDIPRTPSGYAGYATIRGCGGCSWLPESTPLVGQTSAIVRLAAGEHALAIQAFGDEPPAVAVTIAPAP